MIKEILSNIPFLGLILTLSGLYFGYRKFNPLIYFVLIAIYIAKISSSLWLWSVYFALLAIFFIPQIRAVLITSHIIKLITKLGLLPKISETEKIALTSGTIWVDGDLFSGKPNFRNIFNQKYPRLTQEEQDFINNETAELCRICNDYQVQKLKDLPDEVWQFLREKKFFGMIIPKEYGGLGFSASAHSAVIQKLASRSVPLAITAMVPNSLGPAELLLHYGTKEQRNYYLPRLADGRELPCFALTETLAGSDATSISSNGILFRDNDGEIKIRLNWSKRYITLGAYATLIGVAFQLRDPDKLIGNQEEIGITCALIDHKTAGVVQGRRHDPLATPFVNSPLNGNDVIISISSIIGGKDGIGKGWKMLMECLAAGRGISLPATSAGGSKLITRVVANYGLLREQFGTAIGKFEGVEEVIARIVSRNYTIEALRSFTSAAIDSGAKPAVVTAIAKYHSTELFRQNVNDGMDILGGRAIIRGPKNLLANAYFSTPISITVEGANILTRSLIHFGQGAIMCHPFAYKEIDALEKGDVRAFDKSFFAHINHLFSNLCRSIVLSVTRGKIHKTVNNDKVGKFEQKIAWASASFALLADIALARFGGNLKRKEKLNGRFGDILSALYLAVSIMKKFDNDGRKKSDEDTVIMALKELMAKAQYAFDGIFNNLFSGWLKYIILPFAHFARFNQISCPISDDLTHKVSKELLNNDEFRNNATDGIYLNDNPDDNLGLLEYTVNLHHQSQDAIKKIKEAIIAKILPNIKLKDLTELAFNSGIINNSEQELLNRYYQFNLEAMKVDEYSLDDYKKI